MEDLVRECIKEMEFAEDAVRDFKCTDLVLKMFDELMSVLMDVFELCIKQYSQARMREWYILKSTALGVSKGFRRCLLPHPAKQEPRSRCAC